MLKGSSKFQSTFATLRNDWNISADLLTHLEELSVTSAVCEKKVWMNCGLWNITANIRIKKIVDISTLLPCWSVLLLHSKRAIIWKRCLEASFELSSKADYGWDQNANICWIKEPFPKDREEILINDKYNVSEVNDEEDEIDNEDDQEY